MRRSSLLAIAAVIGACGGQTITTTPTPPAAAPKPAPPITVPVPMPVSIASANIRDLAGARIGTANFIDTQAGVLVSVTISGLGLGAHGVHIHSVGKCESPFLSAGDHFNPEKHKHGFKSREGFHLGDMPNIDMPPAGTLKFEFVLPKVTVRGPNPLIGGTGTSIVFHSSKDDMVGDPEGGSGGRLACGVIVQR